MLDAQGGDCRSTYLINPPIGSKVTRGDLVQHADLYGDFGFSKNFLWYAPEPSEGYPILPYSDQMWASCVKRTARNGTACLPQNVELSSDHTISYDFGFHQVSLDALVWQGNFIALACGNFNVPVNGNPVNAPVPSIRGVKYNDVNKNKVRDPGEPGIPGVSFKLIRDSSLYGDQSDGYVTTATSGPDGSFSFPLVNIGPGTYTVQEVSQPDWVNTVGDSQQVIVSPGIGNETIDLETPVGNRFENPPTAVLGPDQKLDQWDAAGAPVTLDGSASYDPDGDPLTYIWTGPFGTKITDSPALQEEMPVGESTVTLKVNDGIKDSNNTATMFVTVYPPITLAGHDIGATEGQTFSGTVGTFTDPDPEGTVGEYQATVDWGDGSSSAGIITKGTDGTFTVTAGHTYAEEDSYQAKVTVADLEVSYNTATQGFTATVGDALLHASGRCPLYSTNPLNDTVATFTDDNPGATLTDFTATIDWGDGTPETPGVITGPDDHGVFSVAGQHTYAKLGPETITVTINDDGGSQATATTCALIYATSGFVVGDLNAAVGTDVTYWGAQWWKLNSLSGGLAPAAFKGYENGPGASTALDTWITDPGNSSNPPVSVPTYMSVIVSSSISQSGSTISGNAPHVVIVQTDPGYAGNPGHAGTGTVVAELR